jgi:hypothetical protein
MLLADLERHARERGARPCLVHWDDGFVTMFSPSRSSPRSLTGCTAVQPGQVGSQVVLLILKHRVLQLPLFVGCMKAGLISFLDPFPR